MSDEREQQIEALVDAVATCRGVGAKIYGTDRVAATALLDGLVGLMLREARRQGAVEALRAFAQGAESPWQQYADDEADRIEQGGSI